MRTLIRTAPAVALNLSIVVVSVPATRIAAQAAQDAAAVQYVASVKRNTTGGGTIRMTPGVISATGVPIRPLIRQAYGPLQDFQLAGGLDWIDTERFDI